MADEVPKKKIARIEVDRTLCIGAATCITVAPDAFELDNENKSTVKAEALSVDQETLWLAAQSCPTKAIKLFDEAGKQLYP